MSLDLIIPFLILLLLVLYLIYTRNKFEKSMLALYEQKFDEWKKNSKIQENKTVSSKELVGLVFKSEYKFCIETFDENTKLALEKGRFKVQNFKDTK